MFIGSLLALNVCLNHVSFIKYSRMKFFSWLGTILIILMIIAAITAPGEKKFAGFIAKDKGGDTMSCKPIIGKTTEVKVLVKICSIHSVSYCELNKASLNGFKLKIKGDSTGISLSVPKILRSETYLGLFGRFWKL